MKSYLFFLFLGFAFGFIGALILVLNLSESLYQIAIPSVIAFIGIFLVVLQLKEAVKSVRLSAMPALNFDVKSGKTLLNKNEDQLSLADRLFTKIFIRNDSKFIIYCFVEIVLRVEYKNGNVSTLNRKVRDEKNPLVIFPRRVFAFPQENLLSKSLLQKGCKKLDQEDDKRFMFQKDEIKEISAEFIISSGPFLQESFKFTLRPLKWTFNLEEEVWINPQGTKDYNITPLVSRRS